MKTMVGVIATVALLASCTSFSGFVRFYRPYADPHSMSEVVLLSQDEEPEIYTSDNLDIDVIDVLSNHYYLVGISSFNGPPEDFQGIEAVCRQTGATLVLVSSRYTGTRNVQGTLALPHSTTSRTTGSFYGRGYHGTYQGTTVTSGTNYVPYSYNVDRYDQTALYFVRFTTKLKIGGFFDDLSADLRTKYQRNQGVIVRIVLKDTPAFRANLLNGDLIIRAGEVPVSNMAQFRAMLDALPGTGNLALVVVRNEKEMGIDISY